MAPAARLPAFRLCEPEGADRRLDHAPDQRARAANQNFDTFNTLNTFVLQGDGAAGMDACFDSLMSGSADEPGALYGLLAKSVRGLAGQADLSLSAAARGQVLVTAAG